jgi:diguanylate cyclase (GGDEF)-like protein
VKSTALRLGATLAGLVTLTIALVAVAATGGSMPRGMAWTVAGLAALVTVGVAWTAVARRRDDASLSDALAVLRGAATRDPLTRALNRVGILDAVGRRIATTSRGRIGVLTLDLDRLATVNHMLGHDRGDTLLIEIADRLVATAGDDAAVGRLGADVFAVVLDDATDQRIHDVASALVRAVNRPVRLGEVDVAISATVGSATTDDAKTSEDLLRASGLALEDAKRTTRHRLRPYTRELSVIAAERVRLIEELRTAKAEGEFEVYFQPVVSLDDGQIVGAEALLRWNHPTRGIVDAALWVDLASEIGLLPALGLTTITECCRHFAAVNAARLSSPLSVAVNLSPAELLAPGLVDHVRGTLSGIQFEPDRLVLEVSEASVADRAIASVIAELRQLGVRIAIDDFGTGSSSLEAMRSLGVDQVKIDRTFVQDLGTEPVDTAIVRTVIDLATVLGLEVVAEGVTSESQVEQLRRMGGDLGQGYLYGRALPFTRFMAAVERIDASRAESLEAATATSAADEATDAVGELG